MSKDKALVVVKKTLPSHIGNQYAKRILTEEEKRDAFDYVKLSGLYKTRLAGFLMMTTPTLNRIFKEDEQFFKLINRANNIFCSKLINNASRQKPLEILNTKFAEEFPKKNNIIDVNFNTTKTIIHHIEGINERISEAIQERLRSVTPKASS